MTAIGVEQGKPFLNFQFDLWVEIFNFILVEIFNFISGWRFSIVSWDRDFQFDLSAIAEDHLLTI